MRDNSGPVCFFYGVERSSAIFLTEAIALQNAHGNTRSLVARSFRDMPIIR